MKPSRKTQNTESKNKSDSLTPAELLDGMKRMKESAEQEVAFWEHQIQLIERPHIERGKRIQFAMKVGTIKLAEGK